MVDRVRLRPSYELPLSVSHFKCAHNSAHYLDVMGLQDRTLLYSGSFEGMIQQQGSPYAIMILFDPAHNTLFFHMTHM